MSEEWEASLDAMSGEGSTETPGAAQAAPAQGGATPGAGAAVEKEIQPGQIPDGVQNPTDASQGKPAPQDKTAQQGNPGKAKPKFLRPDDIPDDEPEQAKEEPAKQEPPKKKGGIEALRETYELTRNEKAKLEERVRELERTREEGTKAEVAKATAELQKQIDDIRKAREEAETELRFANYARSNEYKEKYQVPLQAAYRQAIEDIKGVQVVDEEGGTPRDASVSELQAILDAPSAAKAAQLASEMFGSAAPLVMQHRAEILKLDTARRAALEEYKAKGAEREKAKAEEIQRTQKEIRARWERSIDATVSERPSLYARPKEDDLAKAWDQGDKLVKLAFLGEIPPDVDAGDDPSGLALEAQAEVAARVRSFNVMAHRNVALRKEVASLKAALEKMKGSEPGQHTKATEPPKGESWEDKLDAL